MTIRSRLRPGRRDDLPFVMLDTLQCKGYVGQYPYTVSRGAPMNAIAAQAPSSRHATSWTWVGLALAMFGTPLFLWLFRLDVGEAVGTGVYLLREGVIFAMAAALLVLVRR